MKLENARARLYSQRVEVKIQRLLPRGGCFVIHSFLFRMPLGKAVRLRETVPTIDHRHAGNVIMKATHQLTHGFTVAAPLHRARIAGPRERGHWAKGKDTCTASEGTSERARWRTRHDHARARRLRRTRRGTRPDRVSERASEPASERGRVCSTRLRWGTARTVRDERSHGPAPTHDTLRRNDETAGYARALCAAPSPTLR